MGFDILELRGIERLVIVLGAVFLCYLGYRLFIKGVRTGTGSLKFESTLMQIVFSGTGPGLFFMAFGAIVLVVMGLNNVSKSNREAITPSGVVIVAPETPTPQLPAKSIEDGQTTNVSNAPLPKKAGNKRPSKMEPKLPESRMKPSVTRAEQVIREEDVIAVGDDPLLSSILRELRE